MLLVYQPKRLPQVNEWNWERIPERNGLPPGACDLDAGLIETKKPLELLGSKGFERCHSGNCCVKNVSPSVMRYVIDRGSEGHIGDY